VEIISPDNLLRSIYSSKRPPQGAGSQLFWATFLDNIIKEHRIPESFYSSLPARSRMRLRKRTAILVIKEDIHEKSMVEWSNGFADIVLEFRDQDNEGALNGRNENAKFCR